MDVGETRYKIVLGYTIAVFLAGAILFVLFDSELLTSVASVVNLVTIIVIMRINE
jgi:hypothetical protein